MTYDLRYDWEWHKDNAEATMKVIDAIGCGHDSHYSNDESYNWNTKGRQARCPTLRKKPRAARKTAR